MEFRVWAPNSQRVELQLDGRRIPMQSTDDGWWTVEADASHGDRYGFVLDGEGPLPDPRSQWQPDGVHELSRVFDHSRFEWTDHAWRPPPLSSAVIYEMHVGTFTPEGTLAAATEKLDHLVDLGVTHVEVMPLATFDGPRGWGYDGAAPFAPHEAYGGPQQLKEFVNACHERGLAVILDVVYNHLGPSGNYLARFGPYFTDRYATPWGSAVNFDQAESEEVRRYFCDNALHWLRNYHIDGLRLDAIHAIIDESAIHILEQIAIEVERLGDSLGKKLVVIAESDLNAPKVVSSRQLCGFGLDAQWSDDFHHALHAVLTGEREGYYEDFGTLEHLAKALSEGFVYDGCYSKHRRRRHGRSSRDLPGHSLLGYLQNHDQIGNRALGERISHLTSVDRAKIGMALVMTAPYVPMIFQGEEWSASSPFQYFTSFPDEDLGRAVREGRCREFASFGWKESEIPDPQAEETFERSKLRWDELRQEPHASMLQWTKQLIRLRRQSPALLDSPKDRVRVQFNEDEQWLTMQRDSIVVICNFAPEERRVPRPSNSNAEIILASKSNIRLGDGHVTLPADSVAIVGHEAPNGSK